MANARLQIDKAVYNVLNVASLQTLATGGIYNTMAPEGAAAPYVIFQAFSKIDEHSFDGRYANAVYMVKAVSRQRWPKEASDVDTQVDTLMEDATLSITGFSQLICRRENDVYLVEEEAGNIWHHIGGLYRIMADET